MPAVFPEGWIGEKPVLTSISEPEFEMAAAKILESDLQDASAAAMPAEAPPPGEEIAEAMLQVLNRAANKEAWEALLYKVRQADFSGAVRPRYSTAQKTQMWSAVEAYMRTGNEKVTEDDILTAVRLLAEEEQADFGGPAVALLLDEPAVGALFVACLEKRRKMPHIHSRDAGRKPFQPNRSAVGRPISGGRIFDAKNHFAWYGAVTTTISHERRGTISVCQLCYGQHSMVPANEHPSKVKVLELIGDECQECKGIGHWKGTCPKSGRADYRDFLEQYSAFCTRVLELSADEKARRSAEERGAMWIGGVRTEEIPLGFFSKPDAARSCPSP